VPRDNLCPCRDTPLALITCSLMFGPLCFFLFVSFQDKILELQRIVMDQQFQLNQKDIKLKVRQWGPFRTCTPLRERELWSVISSLCLSPEFQAMPFLTAAAPC